MKNTDSNKKTTAGARLKAVTLLILIFGLGAVAGAGGTLWMIRAHLQGIARDPMMVNGPAAKVIERVKNDLQRNLELTPEESKSIQQELETTRGILSERRVEIVEDMRAIVLDTVVRMEAHLPEGKQSALRERVRERIEPWGLTMD
jgi:hypothetical protein